MTIWLTSLLAFEEVMTRAPSVANFLVTNWPINLAALLGALSLYLLLPRPRPLPTILGTAFGAAALLLAGFSIVRTGNLNLESALFYLFSTCAVLSGTLLVTQRHPARAALSFTLVVLSCCGLFLLLAAPFLMAATIIIYAGAIVVTFLFVLMLAQQAGLTDADCRSREPLFSVIAGFLLLGTILWVLGHQFTTESLDHDLNPLLSLAEKARELNSAREIQEAIGPDEKLFKEFRQVLTRAGQNDLHNLVYDQVQSRWPGNKTGAEAEMKSALNLLIAIGHQARAQVGLQASKPTGSSSILLSNLSGPPGNTPARDLRIDPQTGLPLMPAENTSYLGRSLFTDYLLPVELGGFLLLVAVIGAIAIAQRPTEKPA